MNDQKTKSIAALLMAQGVAAVAQTATNTPPATVNTTNSPAQLPDVVVKGDQEPAFKSDRLSSPKFTQPIIDTPQTVVAIPKEVYTQQGAQTLSDVLRNTPGISFAAGEGGSVASGDSFFMRGFDASGNIFIDGVRDTGNYSRDVFNIEQVEIAKGPSGADSGRGGSSGYLNLATKTATADRFYNGDLSYGSTDQKRLTADLNQPLSVGKPGDWINGSSLRLNGMWQDGGVPGRDFVENNRWGISPSLAMGLGSPTRVILGGSYIGQDNLPDSGMPIVALPGGIAGKVDQKNFYGLADKDFDHVNSGRVLARVEHDVNDDVTLRNQFVYGRTDRDALTTYIQNSSSFVPSTGMITPRRIHNETQNEIFSDQINATVNFETGFIEHNLSSGIDLSREQQHAPTWTAVNGPATSVYNPDPFRTVLASQVPYVTNGAFADATIDTAAVYLFDTLKLNKYFQLNGSVRAECYNAEYRSRGATGGISSIENSDTLLSWRGGIVFKPRDNGSLYFSYANSFVPPGTTFTLSTVTNNINNPIFDPQENINYEVGTKWNFFNDRLSTSLAIYRSENLNNISQDATTGELTQDAENIVQGVEFGISGKITENWMVFGGFGYAHSEFNTPGSSTTATNSGAGLRFTPEWSANLWTAYKLPFGLTLGGGFQYSASVTRSTQNTIAESDLIAAKAPSYLVFNAMAAYEVNRNFTVRLNVYNITDEFYYRINNNGGRYYPGTPLSFMLAAEMKF